MKILIVGAGYVGLTSATVFANQHEVIVVDNDKTKIKKIKDGENVINEPDLRLKQSKLSFSSSIESCMKENKFDLIFLCVGTPLIGNTGFTEENAEFDLTMLESAVENLVKANVNKNSLTLVIKSTVLPGTAKHIKKKALQYANDAGLAFNIDIISNPEFLREGYAVYDVRYPSRVVIGVDKKIHNADKIKKKIETFYKESNIEPLIFVSNETAELSKLASNAFLASKISFVNEQMLLAKKCKAKIDDVVKILGLDPRIGKYINPGIGYGGYCLPKDVVALKTFAKKSGIDSLMLNAVHDTNMKQMKLIINKVEKFVLDNDENMNVGIFGIAFKDNTRDSREAPSIYIAEKLVERDINVLLIDEKETLNHYKGNVKKSSKEDVISIAILSSKSGYSKFKMTDDLKLVIDPNRYLDKQMRTRLRMQNIQYMTVE